MPRASRPLALPLQETEVNFLFATCSRSIRSETTKVPLLTRDKQTAKGKTFTAKNAMEKASKQIRSTTKTSLFYYLIFYYWMCLPVSCHRRCSGSASAAEEGFRLLLERSASLFSPHICQIPTRRRAYQRGKVFFSCSFYLRRPRGPPALSGPPLEAARLPSPHAPILSSEASGWVFFFFISLSVIYNKEALHVVWQEE